MVLCIMWYYVYPKLKCKRVQEICLHTRDLKNSVKGLDPMATSCMNPAEGLDATSMSHANSFQLCTRNAHCSVLEARKSGITGLRICTRRLWELHWSQEVTIQMKIRHSPRKSISSDIEDLSSSNENSQVRIRKTSHGKLLQQNQHHAILLSHFPFISFCLMSLGGSSMPRTTLAHFSLAFPLKFTIN